MKKFFSIAALILSFDTAQAILKSQFFSRDNNLPIIPNNGMALIFIQATRPIAHHANNHPQSHMACATSNHISKSSWPNLILPSLGLTAFGTYMFGASSGISLGCFYALTNWLNSSKTH